MKKENKIKEKEKKSAYSISDVAPKTTEKKIINTESDSGKFVIILLSIVAFIALLWVINILKDTKDDDTNETEVSIQYKEIIVGNMLNQKYDEYFVFAYNKDEYKAGAIETMINSYLATNSTTGYYTINLDSAYNLPAIASESNFKAESIADIKFKGTTVLKIKKGKIEEAIEGAEAIDKYFEDLKATQK